ncbi:MAG: M13 family metallopeptidase [Gammaproteobacteria bacterium]|nr:M13 family metallopeptidase [Gammaproteobacteria bacterium]
MMKSMLVCVTAVLALAPAFAADAGLRQMAVGGADGAALRGIETDDIDRSAAPCDDFYQFANGTWRAKNPIPDAMSRWSRRIAAHEANKQRIRDILKEVSRNSLWPSGSVEQLVGDHYASCMDTTAVDAAGLSPLGPLLAEIERVRDVAEVQRVIRRLHELAVFVPFATGGVPDYHEPVNFIENISAGTLGLPGVEYYLKKEPAFDEVRSRYLAHVAKVLHLSGLSSEQATSAAGHIFALEKSLAQAALDNASAADPAATDHKMTFLQLKRLTPHIDWDDYFDEAKLPRSALNVAEPRLLQQVDAQLIGTPVATWKLYLRWQLLASAAPWLSAPFAQESSEFRQLYPVSDRARRTREEVCADSVEALLGDALGRLYVERYFSPAAKAKAQEISRNLLVTLRDVVAGTQWLEAATKRTALAKLQASNVQLGYPDTWKDYSSLSIRKGSLWKNVAAARRFAVRRDREQIAKPTNRSFWALPPSSADAYIDLQLNELVVPAGVLQPPYFDRLASDAVNYGAFGIGLAHDMTHAIDSLGSQIDLIGRPAPWWTELDNKEFASRSQCLIDQYDGYFIEPGVHHDGRRVLSESIADLAGVGIAYRALQKSLALHPLPVIDGFTPVQQFFISWGQSAGGAMRLEAQRELVRADPHPVPKFRVIGPLSDTAEFAQAFACKAEAPMVRQPPCKVW